MLGPFCTAAEEARGFARGVGSSALPLLAVLPFTKKVGTNIVKVMLHNAVAYMVPLPHSLPLLLLLLLQVRPLQNHLITRGKI